MVLVDSCVWIEAAKLKGDLLVKVALRSLLDEYQAAFCGPVKLEILGALRPDSRPKWLKSLSTVRYLPMKDQQWDQAVRLSWSLRSKGVTVPWNDVLISSIALKQECRVYSIDSDFQSISRVSGLPLYQPGYGGTYNPA